MSQTVYKISFVNQQQVYEIFAKKVTQSNVFGFICIQEIVFNETSSVVVDPGQEKLRQEFLSVNATHIPLHCILRIDEVNKGGTAKIVDYNSSSNIHHFPLNIPSNPGDSVN